MEWNTTSTVLEKLRNYDERTAWELLDRHFQGALVQFGSRMGLTPADAQDAAQEALIAFAQAFREGHYDTNWVPKYMQEREKVENEETVAFCEMAAVVARHLKDEAIAKQGASSNGAPVNGAAKNGWKEYGRFRQLRGQI